MKFLQYYHTVLRVVFSKDQTSYIRGWKLNDSDLDKNRITRANGHNSG